MAAEHSGARSPDILGTVSYPRSPAMATPGMFPGEKFVEPGITKEEFIDISIGDTTVRMCIVGGVGYFGLAALGEAKDVLVDALIEKFGKYKNKTEDSMTDASEINSIQENKSN